ncbi:MAG TPA: 16S rRNA (cytidine(1402)-2'-O)-methyltransferase [Bacillota bacterium]|nr:16S rRNA (cytidine(1402)-2'-O)-methyltransferase [Bacillota bacterium]
MNIQKSYTDDGKGILYIVPTPIGNMEDITYRALKTLADVSVIAAEDTRNTKKLLNHFNIHTPMVSYHEHNKWSRQTELLERLKQGESIAIVSDAGMPAISDPGGDIIQAAIRANIKVIALPGANAALCALIGSGLSTDEFLFYGFLPRKKKERNQELKRLKPLQATLVFYESPYRIKETVSAIKAELGNRQASIARELTKRFEEYVRGTVEELETWILQNELKGEFCLIVEGSSEPMETDDWWRDLSIKEHVIQYIERERLSSKEAIKKTARDRQVSKRDVYQAFHID